MSQDTIRYACGHGTATKNLTGKIADPRPEVSNMRKRIAELEAKTGCRWKGKIYGKPGGYTIYVADTKCKLSDEEVAELETKTRRR